MLFKTLLGQIGQMSEQFSIKENLCFLSLELIFQTINLLCGLFFTVSSSLFLPLAVLIYEVVAEEQEGEDTTGDCDDDEWRRGMSLEVATCKLARVTHNSAPSTTTPSCDQDKEWDINM